jgi:hypothetical protein
MVNIYTLIAGLEQISYRLELECLCSKLVDKISEPGDVVSVSPIESSTRSQHDDTHPCHVINSMIAKLR